jgi:hypothetical protein
MIKTAALIPMLRPLLALLAITTTLIAADPASSSSYRWWKGNLHTHSLWSDGDEYPEIICQWYKDHGYNFLALSDHNIIADKERWINVAKSRGGESAFAKYAERFGPKWVEQRTDAAGAVEVRLKMLSEYRSLTEEPGRFLLIRSEEISDRYLNAPIHLNATNLSTAIKPQGGGSIVEVMQNNINAVVAQREKTGIAMIPHINHPNFGWAVTAEELARVEHEQFFEVYNGHPSVHNEGDATHASIDRVWDIVLTLRHRNGLPPLFGLGSDDSHHYHEVTPGKKQSRSGRGWIMVRAKNLTPEDLIAAMELGDFYASSGVTLKDVRLEKNTITIAIAPEPGCTYQTEFIGTRNGYDPSSTPILGKEGETLRVTQQYSADIGATLATVKGTAATYTFKGDELYVRARITSSKPKPNASSDGEFERAWTQPMTPEAGGKK